MRITLRRLALLFVVPLIATATCVESPTGLGAVGPATFAIAPVFSQRASMAKAMYSAAGLELDHVRLVITRPPNEVVKDTTVVYNGSGDLPIELNIIGPVGEQLTVRLDYLSGPNVLYSGTAQVTTVSPLTPASEVPQATIVVDPVGPGFDATSVTIDPPNGTFPTTSHVAFTAKAFKAGPTEVSGALFSWSVDDETVGTIDATGSLTPTAKGGPIKVRATALSGVFGEASVTLKSPPTSLSLVSGGGQTAAAGAQLTQIVVKVADANGNGVSGEVVSFAVASGGGSIVVNNGTTDASGLARVTWTLGPSAGSQSITATRAGLNGSPLTITATATAAVATKLAFTVQPSAVTAGATMTPGVQITAQDASGTTVTSFTGSITISIGTNPSSGSLGGTLTVSAIAGVATFSDLTINAGGNGYTLGAASAGLTSATSTAFNVAAGTPAALEFITQPTTTVQNGTITPPVQVRIVNSFGATVNTATNIVTIAIGNNPGGSTLGGNANGAAVFGIASFSTLTLNNPGAGYTLTATATGLTSATSAAFNISAPAGATRTWAGAVSNAWSDPANWNPAGTPTVSDSVVIPPGTAFTPSLSANASIAAVVVQGGATLSVGAFQLSTSPGKTTNQGSLNLSGTTLLGPIDNQAGTLIVQGSVTAAGAVSNASGATLRIQGLGSGTGALVAAAGLTNDGLIELTDLISSTGATLAGGTITNTASGNISVLTGAGGSRVLSGSIDNLGTITLGGTQGLSIVHSGTSSTNSGTIAVTSGNLSVVQATAADAFTNTGTITIGSARKWTTTGGTLNLSSGSVTGAGTLDLDGVSVASFSLVAVATLIDMDAATTFPGNLITVGSGEQLRTSGGIVSPAVTVQSGGSYISQKTVTQAGALSLLAGSTLSIQGISGFNGFLTVSNGFANNGTIEMTDVSGGTSSSLIVTSGALVNASGGAITPLQGSGSGARTIQAQVDNQGTITIANSQGLGIVKAGATHTNSGTIAMSGGNLSVTQSGTTPSFTNTGTITIASGRAMTVNGGAVTLTGGSLSGAGTLTLTGATADFTTASMTAPLTTDIATTVIGGLVTIPAGQTLTLLNAAFSAAVTVDQGTLVARRTSSISGALTVNTGSILRVQGITGFNSALTVANGFTNNGTIELTDNAGGTAATLNVTTGSLTNAGTLSVLQGTGNGGRTLGAELLNQSPITLTNTQGLTISKAGAAHTNSSTITLTSGNLTLTQSGAGASFTNTGTVAIGAGRTWTVNGGALNLTGGTTSEPGTLDLNGVTVDFTTASMTAPLTTDIATTVVGGTVTIPSGQTLTLLNAAFSGAVTIDQGTLISQKTTSIAGTLTLNASSTLRVQGTTGFNSALTVANGFTNNGTIELTDNAGGTAATLNVTTGSLTNAGTLSVLQGTGNGGRTLGAELINQSPITLTNTQGLTISKAGAAHANSSTITLTSGNLTLTQSGAGASFTNTGTVAIGAGRTWAVTGGALTLTGGTTSGLGTLDLSGVAVDFTTASMTTPLTTDNATTVVGNNVLIPSGQSLTLLNATFNSAVTLNQGTLITQKTTSIGGTLTLGASSTLRVQGISGFNSILTVANGFTNNGTIELTDNGGGTAATLAVSSGSLTNAGTLSVIQGTGNGARTIAAQLINQAPITLANNQGLTLAKPGAAHTNSSTISLTNGNFSISQSGAGASFTNTGTVAIGASRIWTVTGGALNLTGGTTSGLGTLILNGVAVDFTTSSMTSPLTTDIATTIVGGTITIPSAQTLTLLNAAFSGGITVNQGTLVSQKTSSIAGPLSVNGSSTLRVQGISGFNSILTVANGFTNNGTIELTDNAGGTAATLNVTTGTFTNNGAVSVIQGTGNGNRTIGAQLNNTGTITIGGSQGLTLNSAGATHTNTGSIGVTTGNLTITQATGGSFTNSGSGSISIGATRTLFISGGTAALGVNQVFGGTLNLNGVAVSFDPRSNLPVITSNATTSFNGGTLTIPDTVSMIFKNATISSNVALGGVMTMQQTNSITGTLTKTSGSNLQIQGISGFNSSLTVANGFTNNGTLQLTDAAGGTAATLAITTGSMTNAAGANFQVLQGTGNGARTLNGGLINQGTITLSNPQGLTINGTLNNQSTLNVNSSVPLTVNGQFNNSGAFNIAGNQTVLIAGASAAHTNSGTISMPAITSGTLQIGNTGITQTFSNSGTITIGSGRTISLTGSTAFTNAVGGTYAPSFGTMSVAATSSFTNNGTIAPGGTGGIGQMTYTGVWNPGGSGTINIELGSSSSRDVVAISGAATLAGALNITAINGYSPSGTAPHTIMTYSSQTGTFGSVVKPAPCPVAPTIGATSVTITC